MDQIQITKTKVSSSWNYFKETLTTKLLRPIFKHRSQKSEHSIPTTSQDTCIRDAINALVQNRSILRSLQETIQTHIDQLKHISASKRGRGVLSSEEIGDSDIDILEAARMMQKVVTIALLSTEALYVVLSSGDSVVQIVKQAPVKILDRLEDIVMEVEDVVGDWE